MFRQNLMADYSGYLKMPLTAPSHLLESSILTKHKSLKAEEAATMKHEASEKVVDLNITSLMSKVENSKLFRHDSDRSLNDKPELTANRLLCTSNLLTSSLTTYQRSALVSLRSSLLESHNLVGIPVQLLNDKNTRLAGHQSDPSDERINNRLNRVSTRDPKPKASENAQRNNQRLDRRMGKSSDRRRNTKNLESKKKGTVEKGNARLDKEKTVEDGVSSDFADNVIPYYNFKPDFKPDIVDLPKFMPAEKDQDILRSIALAERIRERDMCLLQPKRALLNAASASLIQAPNFRNSEDNSRLQLIQLADKVASFDPEFVLKVALYTRCELNIRTTANFLLAYSSSQPSCRPYLQKYFKATVCLPSDWIEVAEIYQGFNDKKVSHGSLPNALRKAMVAKFPDFDVYQLSKYNKEKSAKKKAKREEKQSDGDAKEGVPNDELGDGESKEGKKDKVSYTLKQLIRQLHIVEPVEHVMCLIGKQYPSTLEEFYQKRLPNTFDEEKAGKRMKLPTAETWETQVSLKGNKASTWEELIDHRKLPFMAMLRNLRNLIKAGISEKHHSWVIKKLSDEGAVTHSKQFPFRFFSAYEVLGQLEKELQQSEENEDLVTRSEGPETITLEIGGEKVLHVVPPETGGGVYRGRGGRGGRGRGGRGGRGRGAASVGRGRGRSSGGRGRGGSRGAGGGRGGARGRGGEAKGRGGGAEGRGKSAGKKAQSGGPCYDQTLLTRYRKALDCAVKIATVHNIKPIRGTTIILCSLDWMMTSTNCKAAKGLGKPRTLAEIAVLLGLMCKHSCEKCEFIVYGAGHIRSVELEKGTILHNMERVLALKEILDASSYVTVNDQIDMRLMNMLIDRTQINNLICLTGHDDFQNDALLGSVQMFADKYRTIVSPDLLFVAVNLGGMPSGDSSYNGLCNENNIRISGFSDQLLRFVAERGEGAQLMQVEKIDDAFNLKPLPKAVLNRQKENVISSPEKPLPIVSLIPRWRTVRVFISSTFRDMHGERDLLTRFVFPELRSRAEKRFLNIYEVDLRWGISEEDAQSKRTLELCLSQVKNCQLFVGILGERYGWVPKRQDIPQRPEFDWVFERLGESITQLEMHSAALSCPTKAVDNAFFYIRDNSFEKDIPKECQSDFTAENDYSATKLKELKSLIRTSGLEVYDRYPCRWGGVAGGKSVVTALDEFGLRVLNNLWNALEKLYPAEDYFLDETTHERAQHENFFASLRDRLVGRKLMLKKALETLKKTSSGVVLVHGKPGSGKSSLMAVLALRCIEENLVESGLDVLVHCVGAAPDSTNVVCMLRRLCHELGNRISSVADLPSHFKNLVDRFRELLEESSKQQTEQKPLILFLDGLDLLEKLHDAPSLNWLPETIPKNVLLVVSVSEDSIGHRSLRQRKDISTKICVDLLDTFDKAEVIRQILSTHAKRLDESLFNNQLRILASKRESNIPLYLSLACEEVRVFGVFEKVTQKLQSLPQTLTQLMNESLSRIESDNGTQLVALSLSLLFCSRKGLEEDELSSLLSLDLKLNGSYSSFDECRFVYLSPDQMIPSVTILRLIRSLNSFLRPFEATSCESTLLKLDQMQVRSVIQQRYLKGPNALHENKLHLLLAGYYYTVADPGLNSRWLGKNPKAFAELPYHLACAGCYNGLKKVLCDLAFIRAKSQLGLAVQTLNDFDVPSGCTTSLERERMKLVSDGELMEYQNFVSRNLHILSTHPVLTLQQALNEPSQSLPSISAEKMLMRECEEATEGAGLMRCLNRREEFDSCLRTISDLPEVVTCVAMSVDGTFLAAGFKDCTVKLYERKLPALVKELRTFSGHSNSISGLCFVSGFRLCSASADGTLSLWSVLGGHRISVLKGHNRCVASCAADAAGKVIVSVGWDFAIKLWNGQTGEAQGNLAKDQHPVNCVAFHPEGQMIVTGDWGSTLKLWDVFNKSRKGILRGHSSSVRDVAFSPSGRHIASASIDGEVKIWSAAYGSNVGVIRGQVLPINRISFSPSGQELVTASDDHKIKVWSGHIGRPIGHIGQNEKYGPVVCVALDATGEHVAAGYHEGFVRLFTVNSGILLWEKSFFEDPVSIRCIKFKSVEEINVWSTQTSSVALFAGTAKGAIMMLDVSSGAVKCTLEGHAKSIMCLDVGQRSSNGFVVTAGEDFIVNLYEYASLEKSSRAKPFQTLEGHTAPVTCCALNMDETKLATGSRDKNVIIWDLGTAAHVKQERILYSCHNDWVTCCAWSNTKNFLVTGSSDFNLKLWDMKSGTEKVTFTGHMSAVSSVAYSYGCIVSSCNDGSVKVWSHSGAEVTTLYGHTQRANTCDIRVDIVKEQEAAENKDWATMADEEEWTAKHEESKANRADVKVERVVVASGSDDGTIRLWLPNESSELASLTGHSGRVVALACGRGGFICSAALDGTVKLWKVPEAAANVSSGHVEGVTAMACSVDGSVLSTVSRDGMMKIWSRQTSPGQTSNVPQLLMDVKVSQKSVNCVRFFAERNDRLFTGADDSFIGLWQLTLGRNPQAEKVAHLTLSSPVVSLAVPTQSDASTYKLFFTQLKTAVAVVTVYNLDNPKGSPPAMSITMECDGLRDWSWTSAYGTLDGNAAFLTCGSGGHLLLWNTIHLVDNTAKKKKPSALYTPLRQLGDFPDITCLTISGDVLYCCDSSGKLECWNRSKDTDGYTSKTQVQIHAGKVTSILCTGDLIFTASTDKTIKVWTRDLEQVGQFFSKAPVTSLILLPTNQWSSKQQQLACGNDLGEVLFLNWSS